MNKLKNACAAVVVFLAPAIARAQPKPAVIPTLGAPGILILGLVLGIAGIATASRRR